MEMNQGRAAIEIPYIAVLTMDIIMYNLKLARLRTYTHAK